ncbi:uncharacterized protein SPSK_00358 [Sporothrix schenckii 1099-18]|uniref:Uncharacterized protein n=1 Tax=Sporothrix schenckii 1099-18 TaxID=1397361 RepID=A0A0F2M2R1_SPOSC|nr:uncharacterized protein SPSK_00358 [Sporothrix schenckii 1099-18]KJR83977.1 hypothetical protein SPSK_00358 [Sporothrix schenckii 1099-18]
MKWAEKDLIGKRGHQVTTAGSMGITFEPRNNCNNLLEGAMEDVDTKSRAGLSLYLLVLAWQQDWERAAARACLLLANTSREA